MQAAAETVEGADIYTEEYLGALLDYAGKLYLTADNWAEKKELLNVSAEVYSDIESAVSSGKTVIVPAEEVSILDWTGSGYMILSMEDYSGTYRITGGLNGGTNAVAVNLAFITDSFIKEYLERGDEVFDDGIKPDDGSGTEDGSKPEVGDGTEDGDSGSEGSTITVQEKLNKLLNSDYYKTDSGFDCSEIAEEFYDAAGQQGTIYRIEGKNGVLYGYEYGNILEFEYHEIYSDGIYIYAPRYLNEPVLKDVYFKALREINLHGFDVFTIK